MIPGQSTNIAYVARCEPFYISFRALQSEDLEVDPRFIPIWIGLPEAAQIGLALEGVGYVSPLTHDLFINAITSIFDAYVDHVLITDVKASTFYATLAFTTTWTPY